MTPNVLEYQTFNKLGEKTRILRGSICEFLEDFVRLKNKRTLQLVDMMPADSFISVKTYIEVLAPNIGEL